MTASLLLHLHGPLQSWGSRSRFDERDTESAPTKSGLVGLLASALGRARLSDVTDLASLRTTIRYDRPGQRIRDYHTVGAAYPKAQQIRNAEGKPRGDVPVVTNRFYLADAAFTVAFTGDDRLIEQLNHAVRHPRWPLSLGRRSCPPAEPFILGILHADPIDALSSVIPINRNTRHAGPVQFIADDPTGDYRPVRDLPTGTVGHWATYTTRPTKRWSITPDIGLFTKDPFALCLPNETTP